MGKPNGADDGQTRLGNDLTSPLAKDNHLQRMSAEIADLQQRIIAFAKSTETPRESFLMRRLSFDDPEEVQEAIDGMTLALISYCYHRHPRGENVHEIMEQLDGVEPGSEEAAALEHRADDAAALQIPFIVTLNRLVEEYHDLRKQLEARLASASASTPS